MAYGHQSALWDCPSKVYTYAQARAIYDRIKPIRGRQVVTDCNMIGKVKPSHPLGKRSNVDTYSVRLNKFGPGLEHEAVQFVLYNTPVITYYSNNRIMVDTGGYHTASTHGFIDWFLGSTTRSRARKSHVTLGGKSYLIMGDKFALRYEQDGDGTGRVVFDMPAPDVFGYRINRAKANKVMREFKEFSRYFDTFISVRKQERELGYRKMMMEIVSVSREEIQAVLGNDHDGKRLAESKWTWLCETPSERSYHPHYFKRYAAWATYASVVAEFLELIKSDQPEDVKHANFYKATLVLITKTRHMHSGGEETIASVAFIKDSVRDVLYRYFASDILDKKRLPDGVVPNNKYGKWIRPE